jgi:hypothetical protein
VCQSFDMRKRTPPPPQQGELRPPATLRLIRRLIVRRNGSAPRSSAAGWRSTAGAGRQGAYRSLESEGDLAVRVTTRPLRDLFRLGSN